MPTWSDRRTWQAMRDVEQSYWFWLAKGIVHPIEASGQEPRDLNERGGTAGSDASPADGALTPQPSCPDEPEAA
jgi:hypothetical protein